MKRLFMVSTCLLLALVGLSGCEDGAYYGPPPPPPPAFNQGPPPALIQLAERNGGQTGFNDGARDAYYGARYNPRRTRAFHDAPGYDGRLGPYEPYVGTFRNAYLAGYDRGFNRR